MESISSNQEPRMPRGRKVRPEPIVVRLRQIEVQLAQGKTLGRVDGFDEDEAESKGHNGAVVLGRLLAAERHPLEALELTHKLLDAGTSPIERLRKECRPSLGRWNVGRVLADGMSAESWPMT